MIKPIALLMLVLGSVVEGVEGATLKDINVANSVDQSTVILGFNTQPIYAFFLLHHPERMVIDISQSAPVKGGLPLHFKGENLIKDIRMSTPVDKYSLRLVFELTTKSRVRAMLKKVGRRYTVEFIVRKQGPPRFSIVGGRRACVMPLANSILNPVSKRVEISENIVPPPPRYYRTIFPAPIVVVIDPGHGGQDPGAIGPNGIHEKNVTFAIAGKLKALLDIDPMFKPVLTRNGDYFISVMARSNLARTKGASVLVSIHADAAPNHNASGASVWVLSTRRANSEMSNWGEKKEKQSALLGGGGDLVMNSQADPYLRKMLLDLQFGHSQRVGYAIAIKVLRQLKNIGALHRRWPEYASFGVLRSPDIPSLLVETGFISNSREERLLASSLYQEKIAKALYLGLRAYFFAYSLEMTSTLQKSTTGS